MNFFLRTALLVMNLSAVVAICGSDESNIESVAKRDSQGRYPDGRCYSHVADYVSIILNWRDSFTLLSISLLIL